jgi:hypothetical protein
LDQQLTQVTRSFCIATTKLIPELGQLIIARTFGWFHEDFGESDEDLIAWMLPFVDSATSHDLTAFVSESHSLDIRCAQWNFELNACESSFHAFVSSLQLALFGISIDFFLKCVHVYFMHAEDINVRCASKRLMRKLILMLNYFVSTG